MRKSFLLIAALLLVLISNAQSENFTEKEGQLFENEQPYSGEYIVEKEDNSKSVFNFNGGLKDGAVTHYYANGDIREKGFYKRGEKDGTWEKWDEDGNKIGEAHYDKGAKSGVWLVWDQKGTKRYEMYYKEGTKVGVWKIWDGEGVLTQERSF